jgi:hypothetical protein
MYLFLILKLKCLGGGIKTKLERIHTLNIQRESVNDQFFTLNQKQEK